ncbi:MAG: efflux RND transporter periplasmic adaptor subunit [Rhodobacteraceae bacterium]|nr:efflux RND transporter periplasmic adaptor subunit [Paracoccaceae bacterium]
MRWISMLTAALVTGVLYMLVMQREALLAFAGVEPAQPTPVQAPERPGERRVSVVAQHSAAQIVQGAVLVRGETEATRQVEMRAETSGRVISEPLRKGARIDQGTVLCQLDPGTSQATLAQAEAALSEARSRLPEARAALTRAQAQLDEARINDTATRRLGQEGFASETRLAATTTAVSTAQAAVATAKAGLEGAQTGIRSAEAAVATAHTGIERLTITAPFAGILDSDAAELGALMQPGGLCATVIQLDPIRLVGYVPETQLEKIAPGALAGGRLASGREVSGRVTYVGRTADPATRTFRVEVEIANGDGAIRAGQTVDILIAAPGKPAHLLPQSALTLDDDGRLGVRLAGEDGRAHFAPVSVLRDTQAGIWITGLPDQADVIVTGQEFVTDGVPLDVTYREDAK